MTTNGTFGRKLSTWLREDAEHRVPDHLDELLVRTAATRQRPWWSSPERWLSVQTTLRFTPVPRVAWMLVVLIFLVAVGIAAVIIGSRPHVPPPFGPAVNGAVVYGAEDGDIYVFDPETGISRAIIAGSTRDSSPFFARDGSKVVFARESAIPDLVQLMVADADGTDVRSLTDPIAPSWLDWSLDGWISWSPDGTRLAVIDTSPHTFSIVNVDGSPTKVVDLHMTADSIQWRPNGEELVFRGLTFVSGAETYGLYVVRADGTGLRAILPPTVSPTEGSPQEPALSPDGSRIIYTQWEGDAYPGGHLYIVDVDSGDVRRLVFDESIESDYFAEWSPDGSQIVFNRGRAQQKFYLAVGPAGGGPVVNVGPVMTWDAAAAPVFSPDGSKVIGRYENDGTWMFDASGGQGQRLEIPNHGLLTWQRAAP